MEINIKELKQWIAALDSGEYQQTTGSLQDEFGYCCLGVACKVLIPKEKLVLHDDGTLEGVYPSRFYNAPEWLAQIDTNFKELTGDRLSTLNDENGLSFTEIATLLELVYIHKMLD